MAEIRADLALPKRMIRLLLQRVGLADALVTVGEGRDKELEKWAETANTQPIQPCALAVKSMQVLGDLHDLRAEKAVVSFITYKSEFDGIRLVV